MLIIALLVKLVLELAALSSTALWAFSSFSNLEREIARLERARAVLAGFIA